MPAAVVALPCPYLERDRPITTVCSSAQCRHAGRWVQRIDLDVKSIPSLGFELHCYFRLCVFLSEWYAFNSLLPVRESHAAGVGEGWINYALVVWLCKIVCACGGWWMALSAAQCTYGWVYLCVSDWMIVPLNPPYLDDSEHYQQMALCK